MKLIDVFYQGEGLGEIGHLEASPEHTFSAVKALMIERHGITEEVFLFLEDCEEPVNEVVLVHQHASATGIKAHLHRCRRVEVSVTFNGETLHHRFSPATTVGHVKHWAAVTKLGMTEEESGEHVLQLPLTHHRPAPGTHIGALTTFPNCRVVFDLVADQRVNGAGAW